MTAELFPNGDKVEVNLSDEEVTVPAGKVWVVSILTLNGKSVTVGDFGELNGNREIVDSSISGMTLHEDMSVSTNDSSAATITGWQFEYSD